MRMKNLALDRRLLYHSDLTLPEVVLLAIVQESGDDGFMFGTKYLTRALNVSAQKVNMIIGILIDSEYLIDTSRFAAPGVMRMRMLYLGPKTAEILADRKIGSGDTTEDYIPVANLDELIEDGQDG